jgi:hypothetical protein
MSAAHKKGDLAAIHNISMGDEISIQWLAI